ncbi:hypothetical protein [Sphingomonas sp. 2R-10]|uniref:hypothetical protein n=1 Tax=Sphingomonas sp. 2R-10 TaxID=3045148 RepID=UPI0013DD8D52|nr:hypothetical protein [Sphingomonas sp. 2R-10]
MTLMKGTPEQIASDWIAYTRLDPNKAPENVHERGWVIYDASYDQPVLAWKAIKAVVSRYSEGELFAGIRNGSEAHPCQHSRRAS